MKAATLKNINQSLILFLLITTILYLGSPVLVPLSFSVFLATLILPAVKWSEKKRGVGKATSSFIGTFLIFVGVGLLIFFMLRQMAFFLQDIVESREDILNYINGLQERTASATGFSLQQQDELFKNSLTEIFNVVQTYVTDFLTGATSLLLNFLLVLILIFLLLLNRGKFMKFLFMYIDKDQQEETREIVDQTSTVAYKYLWGRVKVMALLSIMYLILFTAYDLRHSGLLILFGALITIIPYLGPFISGTLPILFLIIFGGTPGEIISFIVLITIIQLIESYVLEPILIGSEVEQSPLFIILAILMGGIIWGPAGLILFVPLFSILKIIFDHTKGLKPLGYLIGYESPNSGGGWLDKLKRKNKK